MVGAVDLIGRIFQRMADDAFHRSTRCVVEQYDAARPQKPVDVVELDERLP
jgi:hypothetical protein